METRAGRRPRPTGLGRAASAGGLATNRNRGGIRALSGEEASWRRLAPDFFQGDTIAVAKSLLGRLLVRRSAAGLTWGWIVETEAYLGKSDPAAHSYRGPTRRNASMFGPAGRAYVYAIHSRYCLNVVTEEAGVGHAVLLRAVEPGGGLPLMRRRRKRDNSLELTRGPARLCEAFAVGPEFDGWPLTTGRRLWIAVGRQPAPDEIVASPRVGVTSAKERLWRFSLKDNRYVSRYRRL